MKIVCAIPAYNCETQLPRVLDKLLALADSRIFEYWVVDNRSQDQTIDIVSAWQRLHPNFPLRLYQNSSNVNLGGTHKLSWELARGKGFSHLLILHGDDQGDPRDIPTLIESCVANSGNTILGSRFSRGSNLAGYKTSRIMGNLVLNNIYSAATVRPLSDLGSGLNLFRISDVDRRALASFGNTLTFNYELLLFLIRERRNYNYAPIAWTETDQISNAKSVKIFLTALGILFRWRFNKYGKTETSSSFPQEKMIEVSRS